MKNNYVVTNNDTLPFESGKCVQGRWEVILIMNKEEEVNEVLTDAGIQHKFM